MGCIITKQRLILEVVRHRRFSEGAVPFSPVVFTNGCFDILHVGHLLIIQRAKLHGDFVVVGINSDESAAKYKLQKPFNSQGERACLVSALDGVRYVTIFDEPSPLELIMAIAPDVLIKGGDWGDNIVGSEEVRKRGGIVISVPTLNKERYSTSALIERIRQGALK